MWCRVPPGEFLVSHHNSRALPEEWTIDAAVYAPPLRGIHHKFLDFMQRI